MIKPLLYPLLWVLVTLWFRLDSSLWHQSVVLIREAIRSGDTGQLVLATIAMMLLQSIPTALLFIALQGFYNVRNALNIGLQLAGTLAIYWLFKDKVSLAGSLLATLMALTLLRVANLVEAKSDFIFPTALIAFQSFFAMHWLSLLLPLKQFEIPIQEALESLSLATAYLGGNRTLTFVAFAFFIPFFIGAFSTTLFFRVQSINAMIIKENYDKASALEGMRTSMMANRLYQEIHTLAHDLKTPLVTIRGLNSLMQLEGAEQKKAVYTGRIEGAIEKMNDMISSFLYADSRQWLSPEGLMRYVQAQLPIEDESLQIHTEIESDLPQIYVNQVRVARGLVNIVENALLAPLNPQGRSKEIHISIKKDPGPKPSLAITITDNGMGIPQDLQQKIWEIGHSTRKTSGLGLPFAKQVIEENSGTIALESTYGMGTRVTIVFPLSSPEAPPAKQTLNP